MAEKYSEDREPVEVAHYPVHLVQEGPQVFGPDRRVNPLELFYRIDVCMVEVGGVNDSRSFNNWNVLDDIPEFADLLDSPMNISRVRGSIDDYVAIKLDDKPHMA